MASTTEASVPQQGELSVNEKVTAIVNDSLLQQMYSTVIVRDYKVFHSLHDLIELRRANGNDRSRSRSHSDGVPSPTKRQKVAAKGGRDPSCGSLDINGSGCPDHLVESDDEDVDLDESDSDESDEEENDGESPFSQSEQGGFVVHVGSADDIKKAKGVQQSMVETWKKLLKEEVLPSQAATRNSDRIQQHAEHKSTVESQPESQPESQSTAGSAGSAFHPSGKEEKGKKCEFEMGTTMEEALQKLLVFQNETKNKKKTNKKAKGGRKAKKKRQSIQEEKHTQYVVNRIVRAVLPELKQLFLNHWKSDWGTEYDACLELDYYEETCHPYKANLRRRPDSLLYVKGYGAPTLLDDEALSLGSLVSFEHKVTLSDERKEKDALIELERDHVEKMCENDIFEQAVGYGVMTDGILWRFYQFRTEVNGKHATLATRQSADVRICEMREGNLNCNFERLAEELVDTFQQSLLTRRLSTSCRKRNITIRQQQYTFNSYLDFGERRVVFKASPSGGRDTGNPNPTQGVLIKFPEFFFQEGRDVVEIDEIESNHDGKMLLEKTKRELQSMENELANLQRLGDKDGIVRIAPGFESCSNLVVMEDVGICLNNIICSGNAGKLLACVVHRDVWCGALPALKEEDMCHADIHEGNLCLRLDDKAVLRVKLVDLESAVKYNIRLRRTPIKNLRDDGNLFFENAQEAWDRASVCAILECLWDENLSLADVKKKTGNWVGQLKKNSGEPTIITKINKSKAEYLPASASGTERQEKNPH